VDPSPSSAWINASLVVSALTILSQTRVRQQKWPRSLATPTTGIWCRARTRAVCRPVMLSSPMTTAGGRDVASPVRFSAVLLARA